MLSIACIQKETDVKYNWAKREDVNLEDDWSRDQNLVLLE